MRRAAAAAVAVSLAATGATASFKLILPEPEPAREATAKPVAAPKSPSCSVTAEAGDSLARLAGRHLGSSKRWREIARLNGIADPNKIYAGQKIRLPNAGCAGVAAPSARPKPATANRSGRLPSTLEEAVAGDGKNRAARAESNESETGAAERNPAATVAAKPRSEPPAARAAEPNGVCSATVEAGDTLAGIAAMHLGSSKRWREISRLNGIADPNKIYAGQTIRLPNAGCAGIAEPVAEPVAEPESATAEAAADAAPEPQPARRWVANPGELLDEVIARWALADGWTAIVSERWYWRVGAPYEFSGTFEAAVAGLLAGFDAAGTAPGVVYYDNKVVRLDYR